MPSVPCNPAVNDTEEPIFRFLNRSNYGKQLVKFHDTIERTRACSSAFSATCFLLKWFPFASSYTTPAWETSSLGLSWNPSLVDGKQTSEG
jgi:hypothetical protein